MKRLKHVWNLRSSSSTKTGNSPLTFFEKLEPRILLSGDGLLSSGAPNPLNNMSSPFVLYAESLPTDEPIEQQSLTIQDACPSDLVNSDLLEPILTLSIENDHDVLKDEFTIPLEDLIERVDDPVIDEIDLFQAGIDTEMITTEIVHIVVEKPIMIDPVVFIEDDSQPVDLNDTNPDSEFASSIEIRGPPASTQTTPGNQIVFVDSTLNSYFQPENADYPDVVVEVLNTGSDGINQITHVLSNYQDVFAIHILSHGSLGQVQIGSVQLTTTSVDFYTEKIQSWGDSLASGGDISFYGCNVGAGSTGLELLSKIADLTGADIAASDDSTGAVQFGGDWILERNLGSIETSLPFGPDVCALLPGLLELASITGLLTVPSVIMTTQVVDSVEFTHVTVPEWGTGGTIGQPELPVFRQSYAIPENVDVTSTYTILGQDTLGEGYIIYPMQEPEPASYRDDYLVSFAYDVDYYNGLVESKMDVFQISEPMIAGDNHSVALEFRPFQYDPMTGEVSMVTELEFELSFVERSPEVELHSTTMGNEDSESDLVSVASEADYLIITADEFYDQILPLAQWKHRKGYKTHVARMSEIGTTDIDIMTFLQNAYDADPDKPEYVLLVGDHENVPSYTIVGHPYYGSGHIWHSDYNYSLLAGSDVLADVAIGRLPGDTADQIGTMVDKILSYEFSPNTGYWYDDVLIAGLFQDSDGNLIADRWFMEDVHRVSDFLGGDYDFWGDPDPFNKGYNVYTNRVWDSSINNPLRYRIEDYPGRITPPDPIPDAWKFKSDDPITDTINNGVSFVLHRDHGSTSGWAAPSYYTNDVYNLVNDDQLPIVFSLNCETGFFDNGDYFGEAWLRNPNGGAVAMTGAMRVSYSGPNDALNVGIFDAMWDDFDTSWESVNYEHGWRFGDLMNYAKDRVFSGYGYDEYFALLTAQMFNVLGDPELMLRTATPQELIVTHDPSIPFGNPYDVMVDVTIGGFPVEGALVCISHPATNDHWTGVTDTGGRVTFTGITAQHPDEYNIVVSSHNTDPYEGTIQVIPEGPFARLDTPTHGGFSTTDLGYVDIEWIDYFGQTGLNTATIDANDIWIAGVTINTPIDQGGGVWRYPYTGALAEGQVDVYVLADQVQDNTGDWNVGQIFSFKYDANSPQGHLVEPMGGMTIYQDPGYVEIIWADMGPARINISTLDGNDITITGVTIDGPPIEVYSGVYHYYYTGELPIGTITVTFVPGEVADLAGNVNEGYDDSFIYDPLRMTTPSVLPDATLGTPYSAFIEADGGMEPYLYFYENLNDNLVGWWQFDEMTGSTAVDSSGNDNHGTLVGTPEWVGGLTGGALDFDGSGDYVDCGNGLTLNITDEITIACSFKVEEFDKMWQTIIAKGDDSYRISRLSDDNELQWCSEGLTVWQLDGTINVNDDQWHHVTGVYDGAKMYLYVDGILDRSLHSSGQINTSTYNLFIGENSENTGRYFDGLIDDVRIYNIALTGEEINSLKNGAFFSLPSGLSLDISTGQISGTPTQPGMFEFVITVTDSSNPANQVSQSFSLEVNGPFASLHEPVIGDATNIDPGYVDIVWRDHPGVGINSATIDASDISISGVTVGTPIYQGGGIWRYPYTGTLSEGQVDIQVIPGQVQDNADIGNVEQILTFIYDAQPPSGTLSDPVNGATIYQDGGYVDVSWVDVGLANIDPTTLDSNDITITGVPLNGPPMLVGPDTYRYSYSGNLPIGTVTVTFMPGEVSDLAGNVITGHNEYFIYDPLIITTSSPLPQVSLGTPYSVFIEAEGGMAPYIWSEAFGDILITEIDPDSPDTVEFTNVSGKDIDVSGWQIYIYDWEFHPSPQAPLTLPVGSVCPSYQCFTVADGPGTYPGSYPHFYTTGNINWSSSSWIGVLLIDNLGRPVDFMAADLLDPSTITNPVTVVPDHWVGGSVPSIPDYQVTYQRTGNTDNNNAAEWVHQTPSISSVNAGLILPFTGENSLPPGLTLDNTTGQISGTPVQTGTFEFRIIVFDSYDPSNTTEKTFTLDVVGPFVQLLSPADGSYTNVNSGYIDIEWLDYPGVGINVTTIDAGDINVAGVTIGIPIDQGGGIWRYPYSGTLNEGQVDIHINANEVQDNSGHWNIEQVFSYVYDTQSPNGTLNNPAHGSTVYEDTGYLDVSWVDVGLANIDTSTLDGNDITITGVTVDGSPMSLGSDIYRYSYTGDLPFGNVTVTFVPGQVADLAGNVNPGNTETFTNIIPATIFLANFEDELNPLNYHDEGFTYTDDFSAPGTNLWHGTYRRAYGSDGYGQYYGLDGPLNYNTGARNAGNLVSPEISLVDTTGPIQLSFMYYLETEALVDYDIASVWISNDNGNYWTELANNQNDGLIDPTSVWTFWKGDLTSYAGDTILLRFNFDTIDNFANYYDGWSIDDVKITGLYESQIQGSVWNDQDADGIQDQDEPRLNDWTVFLDDNNNGQLDPGERSELTDDNGEYAFINMAPGTYTVAEQMQIGWAQTHPGGVGNHTVTINLGTNASNINFGNQPIGEINGYTWNDLNQNGVWDLDETALADWTIYLDMNGNSQLDAGESSTMTDSIGKFSFMNLAPGSYIVNEILQSNWKQSYPASGAHTIQIGPEIVIENVNFGNIAYVVFNDLNLKAAVEDALGISNPTGNEMLALDVLITGYRDIEDLSGLENAENLEYLMLWGNHISDISQLMSLPNLEQLVLSDNEITEFNSPTVWNDLTGLYLSDNQINTLPSLAGLTNIRTFDLHGNQISDINPLTELTSLQYLDLRDNPLNPEAYSSHLAQIQQNNPGMVLLYDPQPNGRIRGTVWNDIDGDGFRDQDEPGLEGWTIFTDQNSNGLLDPDEASTTSNVDGSYELTNLYPDTYIVSEVLMQDWGQTYPGGGGAHTVPLAHDAIATGINFGNGYNEAPKIGSLSLSTNPIMYGEALTLTAHDITDNHGVVSMAFYRDDNTNGIGEPGELLGTDNNGIDGWSWSGPVTWASGDHNYLAQATDDGVPIGIKTSDWVSITGTVRGILTLTSESPLPKAGFDCPYSTFIEASGGIEPHTWSFYIDPSGNYIETPAEPGIPGSSSAGIPMGWSADDISYQLYLPWAFNFYGTEYNSVWVSTNGFLDFTSSAMITYSNSLKGLQNAVRIAPLWDDLTTEEGDIYVDFTMPDIDVFIRWEGHTYQSDDPVNFSVALSQNGQIRFDYYIDHNGLTPTIGLSAGNGSQYVLSQRDGVSTIGANASSAFAMPDSDPLPEGLSLNRTTGEISGIPTELGSFDFTIVVKDSSIPANLASKNFQLEVITIPDLVGTYCNAIPDLVGWGDSFDMDYTVLNQGSADTGAFDIGFYLSEDTDYDIGVDSFLAFVPVSQLAVGVSTNGTATVTLPSSSPFTAQTGTFYMVMFSDDLNEVVESNETNNHGTGYQADYDDFVILPDLVGTYCNVIPSLAGWGESFDVDYTVFNQGTADTGTFDIGFYLSEDTDYDIGVDSFLTAISVTQLAVGASVSGTAIVTLPSSSPFVADSGLFYVVMFSDDLNEVSEFDETNNYGMGYEIDYDDFVILPDLVGTYCNVIPDFVGWGENCDVDYTVLNQGTADAGAFDIGFYLSEDTDYDIGVDSFLSAVSVSQLAAGAGTSGTATITLPSSSPFTTQTGTFYVLMFSDDLDDVVESNETNNHSTGYQVDYDEFTVLPDLVGIYCDVIPDLVDWGENFDVDYTVLNQGSADAGAFDIGFYLSEDTNYDIGVDSFLSAVSISQLAAGATMSGTVTISLLSSSPFAAQTGTFYVMMFSDDLDQVIESSETNNHGTGDQIDYDEFDIVVITTPSPLPQATLGLPYSVTLSVDGGTEPYTWSFKRVGDYEEMNPGPGAVGGGTAMSWQADDASYELTLPWTFEFYGNDYNSVWVCTNGFIDFTSSTTDFSNSQTELINNVRIAPLWDDLDTRDGNIYVDTTSPDAIAIRWEGKTLSTEESIDFMVTLNRDGTIRFDYGNFHSGLTPTIGLSAGDGTNYTLSIRDGLSEIPSNVASLFSRAGNPLPPGLSLDEATGEISGVPTELGVFDFTIIVTDSDTPANKVSKDFTLEVVEPPEIEVSGNGQLISDGDTTPSVSDGTDFGDVGVAAYSITHTFTISNVGSADLNLTGSPRVVVTGSADLTVTQQPNSPVTAAGQTTFEITFDPSSPGLQMATVTIANNDSDENPYDFLVQGQGGLFGNQQVISTQIDTPYSVYACDLDGDGDNDIITTGGENIWYENLGGGTFGSWQAISTQPDEWRSIYVCDLDGDGDNDVLAGSYLDGKIAWYENIGEGTFGAQQLIDPQTGAVETVYACDLDGDGDNDVLSASYFTSKIIWYENLGGGTFGNQQVIGTPSGPAEVYACDLDGDGDNDVLLVSSNQIGWFENQGSGIFGSHQSISTQVNSPTSVYACDLDGDGDNDVLSASRYEDNIAWYENLGGGMFGGQQVISTQAAGAESVYACDLDGDGDNDVLSASYEDDKIAWYENLGGGTFSAQKIISTQTDYARSVYACDLDGDGDNDVLSASIIDTKIAWYENLKSPGIGSPEIDIEQNGIDNVHAYSFGNLQGGQSVSQVFTVCNEGTVDLVVTQAIGLGSPFSISLVNNSSSTDDWVIPAGGTQTFTVSFSPVDAAHFNDTLVLTNNDSNEGSYLINFTGSVLGSEIAVLGNNQVILDGDITPDPTDDTDFGDVCVPTGSVAHIFTIRNTGTDDLSMTGSPNPVLVTGSGDFTLTQQPASTVFPGGTTTFEVTFDPSSYGMQTAIISIANNDADENPYDFLVQGKGVLFGEQQVINEYLGGKSSIYACDLDGDGDNDVLTASNHEVFWFENLGSGVFSNKHSISWDVDFVKHVYACDLDGDGDNDVLSASRDDNKIAWYENLGGGTFGSQQIISTLLDRAMYVYASDLDGDGDNDVISASAYDGKIAWYENLGNSTFGSQQILGTQVGPEEVYACDLDGDGDNDVLSASSGDDHIAWYENLGGGTFSSSQAIGVQQDGTKSVYACDIDGDGDNDVLAASYFDYRIAWFENLGGGTFGSRQIVSTLVDGAESVYACDLDNDGDNDILSASRIDDKIAWYENLGGGTFGTQQVITTQTEYAKSVFACDLDGDGYKDVLSSSGLDNKTAWYENLMIKLPEITVLGNGITIANGDSSPNTADHMHFGSVWVTDDSITRTFTIGNVGPEVLNLTGSPDRVVITGSSDFTVTQQPASSVSPGGTITFEVTFDPSDSGTKTAVISITSDDYSESPYDFVVEGQGGVLLFGSQQVVSTQASGVWSVYACDLDSDGDDDVLSASFVDDKIAWYENLGSGTFSAQQVISSGADGAQSVFACDLDGDGDNDVLSASYSDDKIVWYENLGGGTFGSQQIISMQADQARSVYACDLDGDGDNDVLSASYNDNKIAWYENLGGGTFGDQQVISTQLNLAYSVYASDLDGDGDNDVLSASVEDDKIAWYENIGGGTFGNQQIISLQAEYARSVYASDLDGDGDNDVLSASSTDSKIAWYENLGGGTFGSQQVISNQASGAMSVYACDLDGDGDNDVLSASCLDDKIAWYENFGGFFDEQRIISSQADFARSVYACDLDGDGDSDVLSASYEDSKIAWYENLKSPTPEIDILGDNHMILDGDSTPSVTDDTDYDTVNVVGGSKTHTFIITNTGSTDLNLTGNPERFIIFGSADFTVAG